MRYLAAIAIAALLVTAAHAENWQTVNVTNDGNIIEIDLDTIKHNKDGSASVAVTNGRMYLDCNGHMSAFPNGVGAVHIPHGSIGEQVATLACDK